LNVVVGRNGSGKSNFFAAIRFVLNDDYHNMGREERQALLHEGHGSAIMSAYVELVFTQCGQRFQTNDDELTLRRTIGMKKDEYTVNRKNTTKGEVMQMLETAGFSRQNPYYIVPQGRITRLTNMKDSERLGLLKSVAGTQHFTAKKEESMKILNDTNNKLTAIDDIFKQINDRMSDLEEEQQELRDFQEADKERKGLEWALYSREQNEIQHSLDTIDQNRDRGIDGADEGRAKFDEGEDALQEILEHIQTLKQEIATARIEKKQYEDERRDKAKERAQVDLDVRNLRDSRDASQNARAARSTDIKSLKAQIKQAEQDLAKITPKYDAESKKENAVKTRLDEDEATQQRLYGKQGRNARFKSKAERDAWLDKQIKESFVADGSFKGTKTETNENIKAISKDIKDAENDLRQLKAQIDDGGNAFNEQIQSKIQERDNLMDERKRLWRADASLESTLSASREKLRQQERTLSHMMDHNTSKGLDAVRRIKRQHNLTGCFGTLAELITVPEHHTAVEAVAGNSIFHYVVDTDETASKCMEILNRERAGRITFMPLNRLHPKAVNFPQAQDARPLTELIQFDHKYEKAVHQVFGRAIVAQNLSVASQYARTHGLTAVTPEGDRSDKKGALTGGYHDQRHSRLKTVQTVNAARIEFDAAEEELRVTRDNIERLSQRITNAVGEIQKLEREQKKSEGNLKQFRQDVASKTELLGRLKNTLESKNKQAETIAARMKEMDDQRRVFEAEKNSEFKKALTQAEEAQLEKATTSVQKLRQEYNKLASARAEVEAQKLEIELRLNSSLKPRLAALEAYEQDDEASPSANVQSRERELERLNVDFDSIVQQLKQLEDSIETKSAQVAELEAQAAETRRTQEELQKSIDKAQRRLEKAVQKRATLIAARQDVAENIRDLGAVPEEMKAKYKRTESDKIVKRLQKVKDSLKKYTSVNKHAYEHYRKSQKAREELEQRREELNKGKESIQRLIESLDQRKDEAIERTFKQVSKAFSEVFKKLVPAGYGRLKIIRDRDVRENEDESEDERPRNKKGVENYRGVDISVSFNSKHDDQQRIQQLSGGQKSKSTDL
jgi:structural maintenance of chromosome 3 (chondroitin sulfate proteoglycan 6)